MSDKPGLTKSQLEELIGKTVSKQIADQLATALAPMKEQMTSWGDRIRSASVVRHSTSLVGGVEINPEDRGIALARCFRALAAGGGDSDRASRWAGKAYDDALGDVVVKALGSNEFTAGGFMVPEDMSNDIIPLLRARAVIRAAGAPTVGMPNGTLTLPKQTGDISASYVGENRNISTTEPTGGQINLTAKKLAAITPISRDLLQYAVGDSADRFVRDNLVRHIAVREDQAFIRDDGTESTPKGLRYWAAAGNVTGTNGTSQVQIEQDFVDLINDLESNNVDMSRPVWFMSPRSKNKLVNLRDANGNLVYPTIQAANPTLYGFPVFVTSNIPTNLGGGSDSELYLVNMPDTLIAEAGGMEITVDASASYVEGGSLVSAFARDQVAVRAITKHDFAVMYDVAVALKSNIAW